MVKILALCREGRLFLKEIKRYDIGGEYLKCGVGVMGNCDWWDLNRICISSRICSRIYIMLSDIVDIKDIDSFKNKSKDINWLKYIPKNMNLPISCTSNNPKIKEIKMSQIIRDSIIQQIDNSETVNKTVIKNETVNRDRRIIEPTNFYQGIVARVDNENGSFLLDASGLRSVRPFYFMKPTLLTNDNLANDVLYKDICSPILTPFSYDVEEYSSLKKEKNQNYYENSIFYTKLNNTPPPIEENIKKEVIFIGRQVRGKTSVNNKEVNQNTETVNQNIKTFNQNIETVNQNIETVNQNIGTVKQNIETVNQNMETARDNDETARRKQKLKLKHRCDVIGPAVAAIPIHHYLTVNKELLIWDPQCASGDVLLEVILSVAKSLPIIQTNQSLTQEDQK
eukprot:GHVL01041198.1.p1 GENE.GHVL01041198.1~~GHVL01041198.1.p1  ORF type:complete len:415 (+),score=136.43 GHVL01041198.1:59-1246(+)